MSSHTEEELQNLRVFVLGIEKKTVAGQINALATATIESGGTWSPAALNPSCSSESVYEIELFGVYSVGISTADAVLSWVKAAKEMAQAPRTNLERAV